ncbi:MAG: glycosyltransferase [Armatimonadetes bacterium]|nr:glycosyltransferase [Armatimonadota bacterium]
MPTRNRRLFAGQAVRYFLRQDYPSRELIILDDGEDAIEDLVPQDERIRYIRQEGRTPLGIKRNRACAAARGDLIAHWDDDDWIAPDRLSLQVAALNASGADACGLREMLHYRPSAGEAWLYRYPEGKRPWLAGGTLLYRRLLWADHPFPEIHVGEDSAFVWQLPPERLRALPDPSFYVALIHGGNTAAKHLTDPCWQRLPLDAVSSLLTPDRDFYAALRSHRAVLPPPRPLASSVTLAAPFAVYDGYGSMAEYLALGMARAGAEVNLSPISLDQTGMTEEFLRLVRRARPEKDAPALYFCWPRPDLEPFLKSPALFINTMWESSRLPADWPDRLDRACALIVPTRFVADVCRASGVTAPIEVIPEGLDPDIYRYEERPERPHFTTLIVSTVIPRKHVAEGVAAWKEAFGEDPDARLVIKGRFNYRNYAPDDPRISFIETSEPTRGIAHWYGQADVLLALGSEGFGLPLVEGMATGLPVIALSSEGQGDVCREAEGLLLPVPPARWEACDEAPFGKCGVRGVPGIFDIAERLRWVAGHRREARQMGRAASEWAIRHRNIWHKGPAVLEVMERHLRPSRPLRRADTLWVPSWGRSCGIAEYTAYLSEHLPLARVTGSPPDFRGVRLLHIQHEHGIFEEAALLRQLEDARRQRIPIVITEHTVCPQTQAWEKDADALVALTGRGVDTLKARWPGKSVQHIPHGCPTWFPPRKKRRGRTIGAFGFLEKHKGFWSLLDALKEVKGSDLLLFSFAKSEETERLFEEAARGLPVRRCADFLPAEEIARRLALEADILVFWYDDVPHASASGAVRIGLATGVPVLASPTGWFSELENETYRPGSLAAGIERLLEETLLRRRLSAAARDYCRRHSWPNIAEQHKALWKSVARM